MGNIFVTYYAKQIEYGVLTYKRVVDSEFAKANDGFADAVLQKIIKDIKDDEYGLSVEDLYTKDHECADMVKEYIINNNIEL